jgi:ribonucleoside-diphosphate reductase alpha chain
MSDLSEITRHVWETRYRGRERTLRDSWRRVARALAAAERTDGRRWERQFFSILDQFGFLPAGRILAGAGTGRRVTLCNCFVMGIVEDSMDGIFEALKEGALTMQQGGGVGYDFSTLRPAGSLARATGAIASGPLSFMRIWDAMCATLLSTGARRGAMMATLRCDHPDVEAFVAAKRVPGELRHFNLSVLVSDEFLETVRRDDEWPLVFPADRLEETGSPGERLLREWPGDDEPVACRVLRRVRASELWEKILRSAYESAEPGVLFVDRINRQNNLGYRERITATNPCGEIPLPAYGACNLGSINLTRFVRDPFTPRARLDLEAIRSTAAIAVRLLDDVIDVSDFPLPRQEEQARGSRRVGLGVTGLADALMLLGLHYGEAAGREAAAEILREICHAAYRTSVELAREKEPFPFFERHPYCASPFIQDLPADIRDGIARWGIRNSHLIAIAPTGTISLLADNVSSGIEPVFAFQHSRRLLEPDGSYQTFSLSDPAFRLWHDTHGSHALPPTFVQARELDPEAHLAMQAALQPYVDNAISKTINVPADLSFDEFRGVYDAADSRGLKGCTAFRPNPVTGTVLDAEDGSRSSHCCHLERETD